MSIRVEYMNLAALFKPLQKPDRAAILIQLAEAAHAFWARLALTRLDSSRQDYLNGLQPVVLEDGAATIMLVGKLPNMIENGASAFDMHLGLLKEGLAGVRTGADGSRYRSVPFRHKTPGVATGILGTPMGGAFAPRGPLSRRLIPPAGVNHAAIGSSVYKDAKKLKPGQALKEGYAPKLSEKHTTDIYAGMRKLSQPIKGGKSQSTYMTWRTISTKQPDKWQHPGLTPRHFAGEVRQYVEAIASDAIKAYFEQANK